MLRRWTSIEGQIFPEHFFGALIDVWFNIFIFNALVFILFCCRLLRRGTNLDHLVKIFVLILIKQSS